MEELALPTKESIRSAAKKCPEAGATLKELFPKVFEDDGPKYCCPLFRELHDEGVLLYVPQFHQSKFVVTNRYLEHCPFCFASGFPI